ncbi:hypothetical protein [Flavivirga sp. 57AJ16]|uniref:hypothetical protein n=1 Tax=Flavivirga sp. 57AJ16 TaxID=3025307 RepID=UPI00236604AD|nr:hypothetical protein [Flavivirga sp. 57AJ16]MDD7888257.1 hypothetical protein [Flavivirga sp. 57AJ16]
MILKKSSINYKRHIEIPPEAGLLRLTILSAPDFTSGFSKLSLPATPSAWTNKSLLDKYLSI